MKELVQISMAAIFWITVIAPTASFLRERWCTAMRKTLVLMCTTVVCVLLFCGGLFAQVDEDAPRMTASQRLRIYQLNQEIKARTESVMKSDPRYTRYLADFDQLRKQVRDRDFRERSAEFRKKYADFQKEMLRKSRIDRRAYNLRLKGIFPSIHVNQAGEIVNRKPKPVAYEPSKESESSFFVPASYRGARQNDSFETTDFSKKWSYQDCSQAQVEFESGREFSLFGNTSVNEDDCDDIKAARGTVIEVPSGVKRVRIEITLDRYDLWTDVATPLLFSYGNSYAAVGIRVNGWILGSAKKTNYFRHNYLDTVWSVLGGDFADVSETGEVIMRCSFRPLVPGEYRVQAYGRVWVTTDGLAVSSGFAKVEGLQKIKVTFVR